MPKDYKHKANSPAYRSSGTAGILPFFTGLSIGLFAALIVYLQGYMPTSTPDGKESSAPPEAQAAEASAESRPRFDFYAILPEVEVKVPEWALDKAPGTPDEPQVDPGVFILQAGSFRSYQDADRAKANLALLGISADIQRVIINGQDVWFRVLIGPFAELDQLNKARSQLEQNGLPFIVHRDKGQGEQT